MKLIAFFITMLVIFYSFSLVLAVEEKSKQPPNPTGKIAFVSTKSGNWDLWTIKSDETELSQLTKTPIDERSPSWSPDGKEIVYATNDGKLWKTDLSGKTAEIPLKNERQKLENNSQPSWSPDGKFIAFTSYGDAKNDDSEIWVIDSKMENLECLVMQKEIQVNPSWSPDGKVLIYSSAVYGPFYKIMQDIWVMQFHGREAKRLLVNDSANAQPEWSPDGKKIAFASDKTGNMEIWIMNSDGKELKQLTKNESYDADPTWSPDGKQLAFVSNRTGETQIWVMDINGNNLKQLTHEGQCKDPSWGK